MKDIIRSFLRRRVKEQNTHLDSTINGIESTMQDIKDMSSKLRRNEEELLKQKEKYAHMYSMLMCLIDAMPDYVWAKDLNGKFVLTNKALRDDLLGGCTIEESLEGSAESFAESVGHGDTLHLDCARTDMIVLSKKRKGVFLEKGSLNGKKVVLLTHKAPIIDKNTQKVTGTIGTGRIVTKEIEDAEFLLAKTMNVIGTCPRVCDVNHKQVETLQEIVNYLEALLKDCHLYGGVCGR